MSEVATFGGGCFWCVEAAFQQLRGIEKIVSGYAGGARPNPTYEQVCTGATGHARGVLAAHGRVAIDDRPREATSRHVGARPLPAAIPAFEANRQVSQGQDPQVLVAFDAGRAGGAGRAGRMRVGVHVALPR